MYETDSFSDFQDAAGSTAVYPDAHEGTFMAVSYCALGIAGEAGEVAEQVKKAWRNDGELTDERRAKVLDEMGDVMWYIAQMCNELNADMEQVAKATITKLKDRKAKGELKQRKAA